MALSFIGDNVKITSAKVTDNRIGPCSGGRPANDFTGWRRPINEGAIGSGTSNSEVDGL